MRKLILLSAFAMSCATSGDDNNPFPDNNGEPDNGNPNNTGNPVTCVAPPCAVDNSTCSDNDGDGFGLNCALGVDCDDTNIRRAPNLQEVCDDIDNDCNQIADDGIDCSNCMDIDGDGYGDGCPGGYDCDETDVTIYDGAPELCDTKDNDCDKSVDEDFTDIGGACESGLGACMVTGNLVCGVGSQLECDATPIQPTAEICDEIDNDCNGIPDDGVTCACVEDDNEPNESSTTGTNFPSGMLAGQICERNVDWFRLGSFNAGDNIKVQILFTHATADLELEMFVGSTFEAGAYSGTDNETIDKTLSKSGNVAVRVYIDQASVVDGSGNSFTIHRQ